MTRSDAVAQFFQGLPFARALGIRLERVQDGVAEFSMPYDTRFVGDPSTGVLHGGVVSALMDTCAGAAVVSHPDAGIETATLDLRIDYMRTAQPGQRLRARAECHHVTHMVAFIRAVTFDDDETAPVAIANGAFAITRGITGAET